MKRLPDRYADRIAKPYLNGSRSMASAGEWDEELDELIANPINEQAMVEFRTVTLAHAA